MSKNKAVSETVVNELEKQDIKQARMGIVRYLQLYPKSPTVESLLKTKYGAQVRVRSEWEKLIAELMSSKVTT